ncbi:MAG: tRNA 2-thiouridine(34) synthase MnmA [Anaerolineae bacterium]|nr:tRNA 2-thiouridine(34) synthase MnmA [Anaerolineae bacterium]
MPDRSESPGSVLVGMSGGVDSSTAAALLVEAGYRVVGVMLRLWSLDGAEGDNRCCAPDAVLQARQAAAQLKIPFYVVDAREAFHQIVVCSFIEGLRRGITPNPCYVCNQKFRWDTLLQQAAAMNLDWVATGHYARIRRSPRGGVELLRGVDGHKDQSYMLCGLRREQLERTLFPLGNFYKDEVRQKARSLDLPCAEREESQDLCFLGSQDIRGFIERYAPEVLQPGLILDRQGKMMGKHAGLALYTIGQRKGLGVSSHKPLYVLQKDVASGALIVGHEEDLGQSEFSVAEVNWIRGSAPKEPLAVSVKIRYQAVEVKAEVIPLPDQKAHVRLATRLRDITPGQVAAFYQGENCLGGGIIQV